MVLSGSVQISTNHSSPMKPNATPLNTAGSITAVSLQAVNEPYMWNPWWCSAVKCISHGTPPLVVSSVKWLEDELELNALHNPGSCRGSGNKKDVACQRSALFAALESKSKYSGYNIQVDDFCRQTLH